MLSFVLSHSFHKIARSRNVLQPLVTSLPFNGQVAGEVDLCQGLKEPFPIYLARADGDFFPPCAWPGGLNGVF